MSKSVGDYCLTLVEGNPRTLVRVIAVNPDGTMSCQRVDDDWTLVGPELRKLPKELRVTKDPKPPKR